MAIVDAHIASSGAAGFGNFQDKFLFELHEEITAHNKHGTSNQIEGFIDADVLEPDAPRIGGLVRPDLVSGPGI